MERKEITFGGLSNSLSETVEAQGNAWSANNCTTDGGVLEGLRRYYRLGQHSAAHASDVGYGLGYAKYSGNERQRIVMTGDRTGGTFTLTFDGQTTGNIVRACTATQVYEALTALSNIGPSDIKVSGGSFPGFAIDVDFIGQYANTDVALMTSNVTGLTGGTTGAVTITERIKGGSNEAFYVVLKKNGDTDSTLYMVTSSDSFIGNTTWTSLATTMNSSDWFFQQYFDKMFMANSVDGLVYVYVGSSTALGTPPDAPTVIPTATETFTPIIDDVQMVTSATTWVQTGLTGAPTLTAYNYGLKITTAAAESGASVVVTGTLAADKDWSFGRDKGFMSIGLGSSPNPLIDVGSMRVQLINADGSPVTIEPDFYSAGEQIGSLASISKQFHFADETRTLRDNIDKVVFRFTINKAASGDIIFVTGLLGDTWLNDTRAIILGDPPVATNAQIEYAYSYYDTSEGTESNLSPTLKSQAVPSNQVFGSYMVLTATGSTQLNTSDDRIFWYRKEKKTSKWRRLPTTPAWDGMEDFGVVNATGSANTMNDRWMEHELEDFPEPDSIGFPPVSAGSTADGVFVWKQALGVISGKQIYLSGVGQPLRFAPSPDDSNGEIPNPDDEDPLRPVTEYVPDNRAEPVYMGFGQDSLLAYTSDSSYGKVGDSPSDSSVFRRLPGGRGTLGRRSATRYGGGVSTMAPDGFWYHSISRGFSGEDNGSLIEREETKEVRRSYKRLLSDLYSLTVEAGEGTYYLTFNSSATTAIEWDARAQDIQAALENIASVNRGDIEVSGSYLTGFLIRIVGQYAGSAAPALTATSIDLSGGAGTVTATQITTGGGTSAVALEFDDEYWLFNGRSYIHQSRNEKWHEGYLTDSVKAAYASRTRGLVFLDTKGRLMKIADGYFDDGRTYGYDDGTTVTWDYETAWLSGARSRPVGIEAMVYGTPTITIVSDDGQNGTRYLDLDLDEKPYSKVNAVAFWGYRHKLIFRGVSGRDKILKLSLDVEPITGSKGT